MKGFFIPYLGYAKDNNICSLHRMWEQTHHIDTIVQFIYVLSINILATVAWTTVVRIKVFQEVKGGSRA